MKLSTGSDWLKYIKSIHVTEMDLGLERVRIVAEALDCLQLANKIIIVGGTNGKGSTVAALEAVYLAAGYRVGAYTSPMLFTPNEQVRVNAEPMNDIAFCNACQQVEEKRGATTLTPFEFFTLAAFVIFKSHTLDVLILEVGLGGRLDAVNIIDGDVALVTSIGIDHVAWLGETREKIAFEKAGIYRTRRPAICGDSHPPESLIGYAQSINAELYCQNKDFNFTVNKNSWDWQWQGSHQQVDYEGLPKNGLLLENMACVLMAITLLQPSLPVNEMQIKLGLANVNIIGRLQIVCNKPFEVHDVAHNADAIRKLAEFLQQHPVSPKHKTYAVFSMLVDKDIQTCIKIIAPHIDIWYVAPIDDKRGASMLQLRECFAGITIEEFNSLSEAYLAAKSQLNSGDRLCVFGSFHVLSECMR